MHLIILSSIFRVVFFCVTDILVHCIKREREKNKKGWWEEKRIKEGGRKIKRTEVCLELSLVFVSTFQLKDEGWMDASCQKGGFDVSLWEREREIIIWCLITWWTFLLFFSFLLFSPSYFYFLPTLFSFLSPFPILTSLHFLHWEPKEEREWNHIIMSNILLLLPPFE